MSSRRVAHETARLRLSRYRVEGTESQERAAKHATQVSAAALGADRASVWLLAPGGKLLRCLTLYDRARDTHTLGEPQDLSRCPSYLDALGERRVLVIDDVRTHPATREVLPLALAAQGVCALLDAPILREGRLLGVVRYEQVDAPRRWEQRDVDFASSVADLITLVVEQSVRLEFEAALHDQAEQRLETQKMEALGRMAIAIVHDFNNLLGIVALTSGAFLTRKPDVAELAERISHSVAVGQRLTRQLLTFATEPQGSSDDAHEGCDLAPVIDAMLPMLRTASGPRAIVTLESELRYAVVALDRSQIEQLLLNLVLNARDAIQQRGTIQIALREALPEDDAPPGVVVLSVTDDGIGMDESTRSRALEPFFTTKAQGTGLGLATVFGMVRRAGGSLRVRSEPGAGTQMCVCLPRWHGGAG